MPPTPPPGPVGPAAGRERIAWFTLAGAGLTAIIAVALAGLPAVALLALVAAVWLAHAALRTLREARHPHPVAPDRFLRTVPPLAYAATAALIAIPAAFLAMYLVVTTIALLPPGPASSIDLALAPTVFLFGGPSVVGIALVAIYIALFSARLGRSPQAVRVATWAALVAALVPPVIWTLSGWSPITAALLIGGPVLVFPVTLVGLNRALAELNDVQAGPDGGPSR